MPVPDIFTDDPNEEKLAGYFEELYEYLLEEGVPEDRLPHPWHVLSRLVRCIDSELLREWLDAYAAVEGDPPDPEGHDGDDAEGPEESDIDPDTDPRHGSPPGRRRRRPPYLRMLDDPHEGSEEGPEEAGSGPERRDPPGAREPQDGT